MKAWHFVNDDKTLGKRHNGKAVKVSDGLKLTVPVPDLRLCSKGLHGSTNPLDALNHAPGGVVCRVEHSGVILRGADKLCSSERTVLWHADAAAVLHEFACWCAERALRRERKAGREPDARSWRAVVVKREWLRGEATNAELDAASNAASNAARDAARDAAWGAARDAARGAELKAQARKLTRMLLDLAAKSGGAT